MNSFTLKAKSLLSRIAKAGGNSLKVPWAVNILLHGASRGNVIEAQDAGTSRDLGNLTISIRGNGNRVHIGSGLRILLILATPFEYDPVVAEELLYALRGKYPQTAFELQVMQFGAAFGDPDVLASKWPTSRPFFGGGRYVRKTCIYDLSRTSHEWSFLDDISLASGVEGMHGGVKLVYRLWKSLSKYLTNKGHGCIGIRFRR